jgi:hypothetical protein
MRGVVRTACLVVAALLVARVTVAHPAPFSYLDLRIVGRGIEGGIVLHDFDVAHDLGIDPPERLRDPAVVEPRRGELTRLIDSRVAIALDGQRGVFEWTGLEVLAERQSIRLTFRIAASRPARIQLNALIFPYDPVHQTFVNIYEDGELRHQAILGDAKRTLDYYSGGWQGSRAVIAVFVPAGIEHILIGPDHVLFLIGLLLLGGSLWQLTAIVTAFTIGHSITLTLAALDVVSPPASVIEPVIALSIVFVGADNLLVQRDLRRRGAAGGSSPARPRDIRAWVAGVFGLVHGFGFASVLKELGLPLNALGWSLFSFNAGVEVGQLAIVVAVAWSLGRVRRRNAAWAERLVLAGSVLVVAAGAYWFVERVF